MSFRLYVSGEAQQPTVEIPPSSNNSVSEHEGKADPHPQYSRATAYTLTVTTNGQTVFNLPAIVSDPTKTLVFLNSTKQNYPRDWTASGAVLTWLSPDLTLETTDLLEIVI
jgi:hypothetical protein